MMSDSPQGQRFSHIYLTEVGSLEDSRKARFRVAKLAENECPCPRRDSRHTTFDYSQAVQQKLERELGISFRTKTESGSIVSDWNWFFNKLSVLEFLDAITIIASYLRDAYTLNNERFVTEAKRIFVEERIAYHIDDLGGAHPLVDTEFTLATQSAISALTGERYAATSASLKSVDESLLQIPVNYVTAIRAIFGANENLFKLMYDVPRLDAKTAGEKIGVRQQSFYSGQADLQAVGARMLEGFKSWINAAHFFRHEQGVSEHSQPSEEIAILMISQGLSYVRWLAQIDQMRDQ